jgi:hypothetical protein
VDITAKKLMRHRTADQRRSNIVKKTRKLLRVFSPACTPLRTLGVSAISDSRRVAQNCAVLHIKHSTP